MSKTATAQEAQTGTAAAANLPRWIVLLKIAADPFDISRSMIYRKVEISAASKDDAVKGCADLEGELVAVQPDNYEGRREINRILPTMEFRNL